MAEFKRNDKGIGYLVIDFMELIMYSDNPYPICDECIKDLIGYEDIVLIPILNQAYCHGCGHEVLKGLCDYPEDRPIREKREKFWKDYFKLEE